MYVCHLPALCAMNAGEAGSHAATCRYGCSYCGRMRPEAAQTARSCHTPHSEGFSAFQLALSLYRIFCKALFKAEVGFCLKYLWLSKASSVVIIAMVAESCVP